MPDQLSVVSSPDDIDPRYADFYRRVLGVLNHSGQRYLVGGAFAFARFTGIQRRTKDLDLFIERASYDAIALALERAGFRVELTYPHWLAKAFKGDAFVDLIFNSGNGLSPVDDLWFVYALDADLLGVPVKLTPVEETLWSKAFIMERERYDGADIAHLLLATARALNWHRLLARFGPHWRVLLAHLVLFGFVYPGERARIPAWLTDELLLRLKSEPDPPPDLRLCAGTLLSRGQYLADLEQGYEDVRSTPLSTMELQDIADWTDAIERDKR